MSCWKRPSATQVYDAFSRFRAIEGLPEILELQVQSISIPFARPKTPQQFYVMVKYRDKDHTTPLTTREVARDEYTWFVLHPTLPSLLSLSLGQGRSANLVDRNRQTGSKPVGLLRSILPVIHGHIQERQDLCDREILRESVTSVQLPMSLVIHIQLLDNADRWIHVKLEALGGTGKGVLMIRLAYVNVPVLDTSPQPSLTI